MPKLNVEQLQQIPKTKYGFMYLTATDNKANDHQLIAQYVELSGVMNQYILVGNFASQLEIIDRTMIEYLKSKQSLITKQPPQIIFFKSIENCMMRHLVACV